MPVYGATICQLCHIGIADNERLDATLPTWLAESAVHIGGQEPVYNLEMDPMGFAGVRYEPSTKRVFHGNHLHQRCFQIAQEEGKKILAATQVTSLCEGLRILIGAFKRPVCLEDSSYNDACPQLKKEMLEAGYANVITHQKRYGILPYDNYWSFMNQRCDYLAFQEEGGHTYPTIEEIRALLEIMLTARDWSLGAPKHCDHECLSCYEYRSPEEMKHIATRHFDWYLSDELATLTEQGNIASFPEQAAKLTQEEAAYQAAYSAKLQQLSSARHEAWLERKKRNRRHLPPHEQPLLGVF